jgi:predicted transcriptional regulator
VSLKVKVEDLLSSRGRVKVIKTILKYGETNITKIVRESGLNHRTVKNHLEFLVKIGLVNERSYGRVKLYSINYKSPQVLVLKDILLTFEG